MFALNTLQKGWPLSFSSPPLGEITVKEAGCENRFFNSLLGNSKSGD
jgi:hypothetical protein